MEKEIETYEIDSENNIPDKLKNYVDDMHREFVLPIKRCNLEGVKNFIDTEASSYSSIPIGTIQNSVAKKAISANLRTEIKEIDCGLDYGLSDQHIQKSICDIRSYLEYSSEISVSKIRDLLTTLVNDWVFQTTNSNVLKTFYARSKNDPVIEIFINFEDDGDNSYILFNKAFLGIIPEASLLFLRKKLSEAFDILTKDLSSTKLLHEDRNQSMFRIEFEDPESWNTKKNEAISSFVSKDYSEMSLFEKLLTYLPFDSECSDLLENKVLSDSFVVDYLLRSITIDIRQVYA